VVHTRHFYHPDETFVTNVTAMREILERAINAGFCSFINCSTSEVYSMKSWQKGGVREDGPVVIATAEQSLRTSYAAGKLITEFFMRDAVERGRIKGCSVRFANVYSPEEAHDEHIIPHIIASLSRDKKVVLLENARATYRSFLHNSDSCDSVISLLDTPAALDGSVYNSGSNEEIAVVDLVTTIAGLMGMGLSGFSIEFDGRRSADPPRRLLNTDKIFEATGWAPQIPLIEGLSQCVQFYNERHK
jgi:dTDP-glucose 4,6-dehydratase